MEVPQLVEPFKDAFDFCLKYYFVYWLADEVVDVELKGAANQVFLLFCAVKHHHFIRFGFLDECFERRIVRHRVDVNKHGVDIDVGDVSAGVANGVDADGFVAELAEYAWQKCTASVVVVLYDKYL